jgi:class 3 adenylate cyclase
MLAGDRRPVTVVFADLSGFTEMTEHQDPEEVVKLLNVCLDRLCECIYRYGGTLDKYIGDGVMALFGAPDAHEDDPERAIRAALDMHDALIALRHNPPLSLARPLSVHVGVATGHVVYGLIGAEGSRAYTVIGKAANLASRLEEKAEPGQILVDEDTYRLTKHVFDYDMPQPTKMQGLTEQVKVYAVRRLRAQPSSWRGLNGSQNLLVGRYDEAHRLSSAIDRLRRAQGGIVIVEGEAGIGKSRLVADVRSKIQAVASDFCWLEGHGLSYGFTRSYHLLAGVLHSYLGVPDGTDDAGAITKLRGACADLLGSRAAQITPYLGRLLGLRLPEDMAQMIPRADAKSLQLQAFESFGDWAAAVAARKPLVLAFDDLHWADRDSVALIEQLMPRCLHHPILILCVSRPDRDSPFWAVREHALSDYVEQVTHIPLGPLSDQEILTLINSLLSLDYMPSEIEYTILDRAQGNPLFVEELLRNFREDHTLVERDGTWRATSEKVGTEIPATLQGMLTARLDRLDEATKLIAQIIAVAGVGGAVPRRLLARVVDNPSTLDDDLAKLQRSDIIEQQPADPEPEYRFRHMLTQEAAYQSLLIQQRKVYHYLVADILARLFWERGEEYADAGLVAEHYQRAEAWQRALTYLERAGDAARDRFANEEAVNHYARALQVADQRQRP